MNPAEWESAGETPGIVWARQAPQLSEVMSFNRDLSVYAPWFDSSIWDCPSDRTELVEEWAEVVAHMVGEPTKADMKALRVTNISLDGEGALRINYTGAPDGGRAENGLPRFHLDRHVVIEAAARTIAERSRRWNSAKGGLEPVPETWAQDLRAAYNTLLPKFSLPIGWCDLLRTMLLRISELADEPDPISECVSRIEEEFGGLRVLHS